MNQTDPTLEITADITAVARQIGLKPVRAWVPDESARKGPSNAAERTRRARDKAEAAGLKQLSVTVPVEHHALLRTFAEQARAGVPAVITLTYLLQEVPPERTLPPPVLPSLSAWRCWLVQRLLPTEWLNLLPELHTKSQSSHS